MRNSGFSDEELLALPRYQSSDLFTDREKAALDYTVAVMRTPVEVTDELFTRVRSYFDERQLAEITALLTLVNIDRFNAAFRIGSAGFSDGMVCVPPDRPDPETVICPHHRTRSPARRDGHRLMNYRNGLCRQPRATHRINWRPPLRRGIVRAADPNGQANDPGHPS